MLKIALFAVGCLPKELGDLVNLTVLNVFDNRLTGPLSIRSERFILATEIDVAFYAGPLPKVLPISLEVFNLGEDGFNSNKFTGGIPSEWGALTNLKELKMVACRLDGKPLRTRSERLMFATENMRCCAGPPLPEALKLLAPLANIEELFLGGNELGGAITADVAVSRSSRSSD